MALRSIVHRVFGPPVGGPPPKEGEVKAPGPPGDNALQVEPALEQRKAIREHLRTTRGVVTMADEAEEPPAGDGEGILARPVTLDKVVAPAELSPKADGVAKGPEALFQDMSVASGEPKAADKKAQSPEDIFKDAAAGVPTEAPPTDGGQDGVFASIFEQDEGDDDSVVRSLITSLPDVTIQELIDEVGEVKTLIAEWQGPGETEAARSAPAPEKNRG